MGEAAVSCWLRLRGSVRVMRVNGDGRQLGLGSVAQ